MIESRRTYYLFEINQQQQINQDVQNAFIRKNVRIKFDAIQEIFNRRFELIGVKGANSQKITKSELNSVAKCIHIFPQSITDIKDEGVFWIYNINDSILDFLNCILRLIGIPDCPMAFRPSDTDPHLLFLYVTDNTRFTILSKIPYFMKLFRSEIGENVDFCTKSEDIPCVLIKNANPDAFNLLKIIIENTLHIPIISHWTKGEFVYILLKDNNQAWTIIDQLNFITLDDNQEIQFSHFLLYKKIEEIKNWNMKLSGLSEDETSRSLFRKYSHMNKKELNKIISLQLDPPNAYIQFLNENDSRIAKSLDSNIQSSSNRDINMLVYYFDGNADELKALFDGVINVKPTNATSSRTVYSVQFLSQKYLDMALTKSGNIAKSSDDKTHVYELQMGDGIGIFSNNLRIICFDSKDFLKMSNVNQCLNKLSKDGQVYGIKISKLPGSVQYPDVIEAIKEEISPDVCLETCIVVNHQAFVGFHKKEDYNSMIRKEFLTIGSYPFRIKAIKDSSHDSIVKS